MAVRRLPFALLLVLPALAPASAVGQARRGTEFQVNVYTAGRQESPSVAMDEVGGAVVVWTGGGHQDGIDAGVFARRYDSSGAAGPEFRVNAYTTDAQQWPSVAIDGAGGFVVVWQSDHGDGSLTAIMGRRFDSSGAPVADDFRVNSHTTSGQVRPSLAVFPDGRFVVVWASAGQDGSDSGVFLQRYDASGVAQGAETQVNAYTTATQNNPRVAAVPDGGFVVAWTSIGQDGSGYGVFGQRYDAAGVPLGPEFPVNTFTTNGQNQVALAANDSGGFVMSWSSFGQDGSLTAVVGQRFAPNGAREGGEFQVNTFTTGFQAGPSVARDANGGILVTWFGDGQDGSEFGIFGRLYDSSGVADGGEFQVNTHTTGTQWFPSVAADGYGSFVVAWPSELQDGSDYGVFAQRFVPDLIFADDFESGATAAWSATNADAGDLVVAPAAALSGTAQGLQGLVDDTVGLYVQDDRPQDENRYRARFYFDTNGFDPGEAENHRRIRLFIVFEESPLRRVAAVVLRRLGGVYALMGRARLDDNSQADTGFTTIGDGEHFVELDWVRSSGPEAEDGSFQLWIDGTSVAMLTDLDNSLSAVDLVRLGALSVKAGASGTLFWDEFESRRQNDIGP